MGYSTTIEINMPIGEVWNRWASQKELQNWLAPKANVSFQEGGAWEFFWDTDPNKDSTLGCKLLKIEPQKLLRFEWQGKSDFIHLFLPPNGHRTMIEVRFEPSGNQTRVTLTQEETRNAPDWQAYDAWMSMAWEMAFKELKEYCDKNKVSV